MGIVVFMGTLIALHIIGIVMVFFYPDYPGFSGLDHLGCLAGMLLLGGAVYGIPVMIIGGTSLFISIIYLICYTIVYIFILIGLHRKGRKKWKRFLCG
jgi:hypothetical protein